MEKISTKKLLAFGLIIFGIIGMTNTVSAGIDSIALVSPSDKDWTSDTTPSFVFRATSNSSQFNCTLIIDSASYGTNNTVQNSTRTTMTANAALSAGSHLWHVNCSDNENSSVSASRTLYIYSSNLVTSWYTTNGSAPNEIAYPNPHSVLVNRTVNFYITLNSSKFSNGWNATIEGWNGTNWVPVTFIDYEGSPFDKLGSSNTQANLTILDNDFKAANIVLSNSTNKTMRILLSNKSTAYIQMLEVGVWNDMYVLSTSLSTMTVGNTVDLYFNVTDWKGTLIESYMNYTPTAIINESYSSGSGYDIKVYQTPQSVNHRPITPKYAGNLTLFIVTSSGVNIRDTGIKGINKTIVVNPRVCNLNIGLTSEPTNIYKDFNTNVTINITLLNETIMAFDTYKSSNISYNVTLTAGGINASKAASVNLSSKTYIEVVFNYTDLNYFNSTKVGTGDVPIDVNVILDSNRDGTWDYNCTKTSAGTVTDANDLNIISVTPTDKILYAGRSNTITYTVKNKSNKNIPFNITLTSTAYFYNGSSTTAVKTLTQANTSGGTVTLSIIPEQKGTISVSITSGSLTPATDQLNITGCIVSRSAISPALGTRLEYNKSQTVTVAVKKNDGNDDYAATVTVSGGGYSVSGNHTNISGTSSDGVLYTFTIQPNVTGYLNITVRGSGCSATFINAYKVKYMTNYTIETTYGADTVTALTEGLNNTFNVTIKEGSDINSGNLSITFYNATQSGDTYISRVTIGIVSNMTTVRIAVPKNAARAELDVTNDTEGKSGNLTLGIIQPDITVSNVLLMNSSDGVLVSKDVSDFVVINNTKANITFTVTNAPYAENLNISVYKENGSGTFLSSVVTNTTNGTVELTTADIADLVKWNGLNATKLFVVMNNSGASGWNLLNITLVEPTIVVSKDVIPVNTNTSVNITVKACEGSGQELHGLNVTVTNSTNTTMASNITDGNGLVTLKLGPTVADTLYIWINGIRTTKTIGATNKLAVDYTPSLVGIGTEVTLYVRPSGSSNEVVENSIVKIEDPHGNIDTWMATDGTYVWTPDEAGVWTIWAVKEGWTTSDYVYINVLTEVTTTTTTTTTITTTTIPIGAVVVINEFVSDPSSGEEWIELYNKGDTDANLTGWTIEDNTATPATLSGTLASLDYLVLTKGTDFTFTLNNDGDIIVLKDTTATIVDQVAYGNYDDGNTADNAPAPGTGNSTGRYPNGADTDVDNVDFTTFDTPTPGAANEVAACTMPGNTPPCDTVELEEVVDAINDWAAGTLDLGYVIDLINSWADPTTYPPS